MVPQVPQVPQVPLVSQVPQVPQVLEVLHVSPRIHPRPDNYHIGSDDEEEEEENAEISLISVEMSSVVEQATRATTAGWVQPSLRPQWMAKHSVH
jgi:hypothetical protein